MARRTSGRPTQAYVSGVPKTCRRPRARAAAMVSSPQSGHPVSQVPSNLAAGSLLSLLGPEASAGAVASALTAGSIVVDLNDMLKKGGNQRSAIPPQAPTCALPAPGHG